MPPAPVPAPAPASTHDSALGGTDAATSPRLVHPKPHLRRISPSPLRTNTSKFSAFQVCRGRAAITTQLKETMEETSMSKQAYKWQRVLLKVSGEALAGDHTENIDPK
ncbi:hypothetical protein Taro_025748, partial [Colocasia esculenta]|nr:hypothetical protein [Colocasia esculenta]